MKLSSATIVAQIPGRDDVLIVQPITGHAAVLPGDQGRLLESTRGQELPVDAGLFLDDLREAGFVVESEDDDRARMAEAYASYLSDLDKTPTQLVVVPTFGCNLSCTYCYQELFEPEAKGLIAPSTIDALFAYLAQKHGHEQPRPYITLFGGEPLVDTPAHRERIAAFLNGARLHDLSVAVVTNGYDLASFVPLLAEGPVREVQVTLDGPPAVHDRRRPHVTGKPTFDRIVAGVRAAVGAKIPVNLRVVVDRENLGALPELASLAEGEGWLELPESQFKTQVGRNYELFGCASRQRKDRLFDRVELWAAFSELAVKHPVLGRFHKPRFHGMGHLARTGELPPPNFDACPATKKEWAFAPDGSIYGCTATVGNPRYRLGSYAPVVQLDQDAIAVWSKRSVFGIPGCAGCELAPVCGGGCGALASEQHGDILGTDCRPVRELLGLGAAYYRLGED